MVSRLANPCKKLPPSPPLSPQPSFINPLSHSSPKLISTLLSSRDRALGPAATQ